MDEQTMELFSWLGESMNTLIVLKIMEMLASDKYTTSMKVALVQLLISANHGQLPMDVSEITGKDESALEMMFDNGGNNGSNYDNIS